MAIWQDLLDRPEPDVHFVQLYTDHAALARNVGRYLAEGFLQGDCGIVIATPAHREAFRQDLENRGVDVGSVEQSAKLLFLDAEQTLGRFMVNGRPEWRRFEKFVSAAVRSLGHTAGGRVRAYGEMVGVLWTSGEYSAAIKLEEFWNRILGSLGASLFCSYPIDVFGPEFKHSGVHAILCDHTHLLPGDAGQSLEESIRRAMDEILGKRAQDVRLRMEAKCRPGWGIVPAAEGMILWLRENVPEFAAEILCRARQDHSGQTLSSVS